MKCKRIGMMMLCLLLISSGCQKSNPESKKEVEAVGAISENSTDDTLAPYDLYAAILAGVAASDKDSVYSVYDMDGNGINELILWGDPLNTSSVFRIYTIDTEGKVVELGTFPGYESELYANDDGEGIICVKIAQGYQTVTVLRIENEQLVHKPIDPNRLETDDFYENPYPLAKCYVHDQYLLEPDAKRVGYEMEYEYEDEYEDENEGDLAQTEDTTTAQSKSEGANADYDIPYVPLVNDIIGSSFSLLKAKRGTYMMSATNSGNPETFSMGRPENIEYYLPVDTDGDLYGVIDDTIVSYAFFADSYHGSMPQVRVLLNSIGHDVLYTTEPAIIYSKNKSRAMLCWKLDGSYLGIVCWSMMPSLPYYEQFADTVIQFSDLDMCSLFD